MTCLYNCVNTVTYSKHRPPFYSDGDTSNNEIDQNDVSEDIPKASLDNSLGSEHDVCVRKKLKSKKKKAPGTTILIFPLTHFIIIKSIHFVFLNICL